MNKLSEFEALTRRRRTVKVMSDVDFPISNDHEVVENLLKCAGWAPFHRPCNEFHRADTGLGGVEPWRFYAVDSNECRQLEKLAAGLPAAGKIPAMLASATTVIVATWLPNPPPNPQVNDHPEYYEPTIENTEHIAAASAAVQSLLLGATSAGIDTYWSSGGVLRSPEVLQRLGIPLAQRVLGVIFLFPSVPEPSDNVQVVESKLRASRGEPSTWSRWVQVRD